MGRGIFYPGGLNKAPFFLALVNAVVDHEDDWLAEVATAKDEYPDLWASMMAVARKRDPDATTEELEDAITDGFMKETHFAISVEELAQRHYDDLEMEILADLIDELPAHLKLRSLLNKDQWSSGNYDQLTRAKNDADILLFAENDDVVIGAVLDDGMIPVVVMPKHLADPRTQELDELEDDELRGLFGVDRNQRLLNIELAVAEVGKAVGTQLLQWFPGNVYGRETAWTMGPLVLPQTKHDLTMLNLGTTPDGAVEGAMAAPDSDWLEAA